MAAVTVVGLGPAGADLVTAGTRAAIERVARRFLRTARHPAAAVVPGALSFDHLYERCASLGEVYRAIVERLVAEATRHGEVLYAVPGSPAVAEQTVALLRADHRVRVEVVPALSFLDLAWARLGVDPVRDGVRVVDGHRFATEAAGQRAPLLVVQCDSLSVLSAVKLAVEEPPSRATVLQRLGLPDESVVEVPWPDLDRSVAPDHLTSLWLPDLAGPVAGELVRLAELVRTLRAECPWDRQQTHRSLTRHLLEETYEVLEAIEGLDEASGRGYAELEDELGDLLFQVVFHATLGAEAGQFGLADVARRVHDKLVRRHPHVFADVEVSGADDVVRNWEQIKRAERGTDGVMATVAGNLPSLLYAHKVQRKAAAVGVHIEPPAHIDLGPLTTEDDLGRALFDLVAVARAGGLDPEAALRATSARFRRQVAEGEAAGGRSG